MVDTKVYVDGKEVGFVVGKVVWDLSASRDYFDASIFGAGSKTFYAAGGPMYRYGDVVTSKASGLKLMVLRRVSGFSMRRPDEWECFALNADIDPANRIGHWKEDEIE